MAVRASAVATAHPDEGGCLWMTCSCLGQLRDGHMLCGSAMQWALAFLLHRARMGHRHFLMAWNQTESRCCQIKEPGVCAGVGLGKCRITCWGYGFKRWWGAQSRSSNNSLISLWLSIYADVDKQGSNHFLCLESFIPNQNLTVC